MPISDKMHCCTAADWRTTDNSGIAAPDPNNQLWGEQWVYSPAHIGNTVKTLAAMAEYINHIADRFELDNIMVSTVTAIMDLQRYGSSRAQCELSCCGVAVVVSVAAMLFWEVRQLTLCACIKLYCSSLTHCIILHYNCVSGTLLHYAFNTTLLLYAGTPNRLLKC
jgi:hypothetical protein